MLSKLRSTWNADDFSYFLRYFATFTIIFGTMYIIILQIMRMSIYNTVDEKIQDISKDPKLVVSLAVSNTKTVLTSRNSESSNISKDSITEDLSNLNFEDENLQEKEQDQMNDIGNVNVILYDQSGSVLLSTANSSVTGKVSIKESYLEKVKDLVIITSFGEEHYRYITIPMSVSNFPGMSYAAVLVNATQIDAASKSYERIILFVMTSFWLISILASVYLASISVKPLLESIQAQQAFVENASHELRTPIAVLQNRLETLFRKPKSTIMDSSESIAASLEEVRNMKLLTTNLLNLARRDDGIEITVGKIEPRFFDTIFENYAMIAEGNGKKFHFLNKVDRIFYSDKTLLKQLMTILFDNAVKHTDEDGEIFCFVVVSRERNLVIKVADNGPGIHGNDKKKIFDRFFRVDKSRTRQKGGFGLGLSLARQIVEALKGTITVKDNKPKGTIFEVKIETKISLRGIGQ